MIDSFTVEDKLEMEEESNCENPRINIGPINNMNDEAQDLGTPNSSVYDKNDDQRPSPRT